MFRQFAISSCCWQINELGVFRRQIRLPDILMMSQLRYNLPSAHFKAIPKSRLAMNYIQLRYLFFELVSLNRSKEIFFFPYNFSLALRGTILSPTCAHTWSTSMSALDCDMKLFFSRPLAPLVLLGVFSRWGVKKIEQHASREGNKMVKSWEEIALCSRWKTTFERLNEPVRIPWYNLCFCLDFNYANRQQEFLLSRGFPIELSRALTKNFDLNWIVNFHCNRADHFVHSIFTHQSC